MQQWSIFENLSYYLDSSETCDVVFQMLDVPLFTM